MICTTLFIRTDSRSTALPRRCDDADSLDPELRLFGVGLLVCNINNQQPTGQPKVRKRTADRKMKLQNYNHKRTNLPLLNRQPSTYEREGTGRGGASAEPCSAGYHLYLGQERTTPMLCKAITLLLCALLLPLALHQVHTMA